MKRLLGNCALACVIVLACVSCSDALGLHDFAQRPPGADPEEDSAVPNEAIEDAASPSPTPTDAQVVEANAPATSASTASPTGSTSSGTSADAEVGTSRPDASAAGQVLDGEPVVEAGAPEPAPAPPPPDSGANACGCPMCVVHSNGVGETFQDCVPGGTHDEAQALEACSVFTGSRADCMVEACPGGGGPGKPPGQAVCGTRASVCDCWAFAGTEVGLVQSSNGKCKPCGSGGSAWN